MTCANSWNIKVFFVESIALNPQDKGYPLPKFIQDSCVIVADNSLKSVEELEAQDYEADAAVYLSLTFLLGVDYRSCKSTFVEALRLTCVEQMT